MSPSRGEGEGGGGGRETSGGIWARERGNTAHITGEQLKIELGREENQRQWFFLPFIYN